MEYPYIRQVTGDFLPLVPLQFWGVGRWFYCMAYADSGASISVFQMEVAKSLGLKKDKGRPHEITVGDGNSMPVLLYNLKVRFSNFVFWAQVGFSNQLGVGFNIIGRASFFERFRICFNEHDKIVSTLRLF